jgi:hypothetical protein
MLAGVIGLSLVVGSLEARLDAIDRRLQIVETSLAE